MSILKVHNLKGTISSGKDMSGDIDTKELHGMSSSSINEKDPLFKSSPAYNITNEDIEKWNNSGVDLTDYVKNTDYANSNKGGVFKTAPSFATNVTSDGYLVNSTKTYNDYQNASGNMFVSKGTLDNVIVGKNLVSDDNYVHTDNNFTNEDKTKIDSLENYVSYNTQSKTTTQQNQARKNIGIPNSCVLYNQNQRLTEANKFLARKNIDAKKSTKDLGVVDLSQYNDDVFEFISTLISDGEYKFVDNRDGFTWLVNVVWLGDYLVGQSHCNSEEGYEYIYYRNGYYDENTDTYSWNNWVSFLTSSQGLSLFALKNHVHYGNVTTAYTIRTYLDGFTGNGNYRITSNLDKEKYIFSGYYYNVSVNGAMQYRRSQRYYSISEPWKIYSRFGLYNTSTKKITWNAWHVVEGVEE